MRDVDIPNWLKGLPLAPEFRPTDTEFADPIAYISKIEKEASVFGICKVIPPLPKPSKKYVLHNLNRSLSKCPDLVSDANISGVCSPSKLGSGDKHNDVEDPAVFTTRHQELGQSVKKSRGAVQLQQPAVQKQVWQSGEAYTLEQFETKSKAFARSLLSMVKEVSPVVVEAMFWKATSEKPIYIEYANDVPGSGFSEPEGSHRYFLKRKRKRIFKKNCGATSVCKKHDVDAARNSHSCENSVASDKLDPNLSIEIPKACSGSSTLLSDETSQVSRQKSSNASSEMEGTAGWKLSNSPWNLQVIARSPGSLTRFMPDDIPGVTSPMVYIGMLFSWFAWHVEDHELHSMNYLHTGSPKTWYAVPGDYAFDFEEVIRTQAYGGNIDRLAALKLLGEKTTLLSPEVVVASGIPCCRLIQHPGEFVVTFPRAYHVGFSHGFNCGEAANFGTPQWLEVAKEAAVRRAAMNYLPMLSHQQLLYLLTMSFVSRVPRSLLPGARSSRLKDRQKEEREKSVKKAFIEDIAKENKLSTVLLAKDSTYRAVLWDPESLPSCSKESRLPSGIAAVDTTAKEFASKIHPDDNNSQQNNLFDEMSNFMQTVNDLYLDDDDLSCDFQVDSGTLACVACGILGFPFMSVVQPSERASMELMPADHSLLQEGSTISKSINTCSSSDVDGIIKSAVLENLFPVLDNYLPQEAAPSTTKLDKAWNASSGFIRPRIFCLEHAVQIEDLLRSKGGANVLVICHSDYQKMKAHAAVIAEEIKCSFKYNEVPLDNASQEDLKLINLAIDEEEHDECGEDWTSKLGINLRYCVKVRKNSPSPKIQHALTLGGLFYDMTPASSLYLKWQSRRSRSKFKLNHSVSPKPCQSIHINDDKSRKKLDDSIARKEEKIIQYSRRRSKFKSACSSGFSKSSVHPIEIISATFGDLDKSENIRSDSAGLDLFASVGKSEMHHEIMALEATGHMSKNSIPAQVANSLAAATSFVGSIEAHIDNQTSEEMTMDDEACHLATKDSSEMQNEMKIAKETNVNYVTTFAEDFSSLSNVIPSVVSLEMQREIGMEENNVTDVVCNLVIHNTSEGKCDMQAAGDVLSKMVSDLANPFSSPVADHVVETYDVQVESKVVEKSSTDSEFSDGETGDNEMQLEIQTTHRNTKEGPVSKENCTAKELCIGATMNDKMAQEIQTTNGGPALESASSYVTLTDKPSTAPMDHRSEVPEDTGTSEELCNGMTLDDKVLQEIQTTNESNAKEIISNVSHTDQPGTVPVDGRSKSQEGICAAEDVCNGVSSDEKVRQEIQTTKGTCGGPISGCEGPISGCITQPSAISVGNGSDALCGMGAEEDLCCHSMALDSESKQEIQAKNGSNEVPVHVVAVVRNQCLSASTGESSEVPRDICTQESLCNGTTSTNGLDRESQTANRSNGEDSISSCLTLGKECSLAVVEESLKVLTETCTADDLTKCATFDNEVLSPAPVKESFEDLKVTCSEKKPQTCVEACFSEDKSEQKNLESTAVDCRSSAWKGRKRKREIEQIKENKFCYNGFFRSPCEGLRPRARKDTSSITGSDMTTIDDEKPVPKKVRKSLDGFVPLKGKKESTKRPHSCDLDSCRMRFKTKAELLLHKRNQCPHPECGKRFTSHKYAILHERVHDDDRPLKCPWKGCTMSFKWAWARTEHLRVHTGERPYQCQVEGCGLCFRFISDFSRHRRKTGHRVN